MERHYADRERSLEVNRKWREQNRDAYMANHRKQEATRRARKKNAFVESVDPRVVLERSSGTCGICGEPIEGDFHVDHIVPLSRGGEHSYANTQATHPRCNWDKGDKI
jgi:5-methylcytosine-specific restriction endonuclease McrA